MSTDNFIIQRLYTKLVEVAKPGMTAEAIAKACEKAIKEVAAEVGQTPDIEVFCKGPDEDHFAGNCWVVSWEAGPYQWGVALSLALIRPANRLIETYFGFDLDFYEHE